MTPILYRQDEAMCEDNPSSTFRAQVRQLQTRAREELAGARETAHIKIQDIVNMRKKMLNRNLFTILGLPLDTKVGWIIAISTH